MSVKRFNVGTGRINPEGNIVKYADYSRLLASHEKLVEALEKAAKLARRTAWIAYVWNDHNFEDAHIEARRECNGHGINSFKAANDYLESVDTALREAESITKE